MNKEDERKEHHRNAFNNYLGVMAILAQWEGKVEHDDNEPLPLGWESEPLLLLGDYLHLLNLNECEKKTFRESTLEMVERYGVESVWQCRMRYAAEIQFIQTF
ncbi:MAG: hypothetical protein ABSB79_09020 [Syntrophales bacterium]|jgi:hypothetical protein